MVILVPEETRIVVRAAPGPGPQGAPTEDQMLKGGGIAFDQSQYDGLGLIVDAVRAALASTPTQRRAGRVELTRSEERPAAVCRRLAPLGTFGDTPTRRTTPPGGDRWP